MNAHSHAHVGVIGMAVMGSNLARNLTRNGYSVALYNRTTSRTESVVAEHGGEGDFRPAVELDAARAAPQNQLDDEGGPRH